MIDTVNFKLKNVSNYPLIKTQYEATANTGQTIVETDTETGEIFSNTKIRAILHHDSDNFIPLTKRSSLYIASSHYTLSHRYNIAQDEISFDFSIPKYLFGTNIIQFIRYFDQSAETIYKYLMSFLTGFVRKHFIEPVDLKDIHITRIDFCYNQFFNSQYDSVKYLTEQKELLTKYARSTRNDYRNYDTSFVYITNRYSFKIYHKGTEFKKHDRKKLQEKNPTGHDLNTLQDIANRVNRYEITYRKSMLDYLYKEKELHNKDVSFLFSGATRKSLRSLSPAYYDQCLQFIDRGKNYVLTPVSQDHSIRTQDVYFSFDVFKVLYNHFWEYVQKYQLECKMSVYDVVKKVDEKNAERDKVNDEKLRKKMSFNKPMLVTLALLTQTYSLDELRKSGLLPKTTFYRYQNQLAKLGYTSKGRLIDIPPPSLDYLEYLSYFSSNHLK